MVSFYLYANALLYLLLSVWCILKPTVSANSLGYNFLNNSGKVEYLVIYTGLELAFTAFLALSAFLPSMRFSGLVFCVFLYVFAIIIRTITALYYGNISKVTYFVGGLEYVLGIWGIILLVIELKKSNPIII